MHNGVRRLGIRLLIIALLVATAGLAEAKPKSKRKPKRKGKASSSVTVPVNVGLGPTFNMITGPVQADQQYHYGLKIDVHAVIDKKTIRRFAGKIPKKYRGMAKKMHEVKYRPSIWIPDHLFISPATANTGMYGITWRPISVAIPLIRARRLRLEVGAGLLLTYAYIMSQAPELPDSTHFLRPGLDLKAELVLGLSDSLLLSGGWSSGFYVPQQITGEDAGIGSLGNPSDDNCVWHIGQIFAMLHFRFPYTTRL